MFSPPSACEEFQEIAQAETQDLTRAIFERLWVHVERLLTPLPMEQKLHFAGVAIERIAQAISDRAEWLLGLEDLDPDNPELQEQLGLPSVTVLDEFIGERGPTLNFNDWFDENLLPPLPQSKQRVVHFTPQGEPSEDAETVRNNLIELTGEQNGKDCDAAIAAFFKQHPDEIAFLELQEVLMLPTVDLWMGLLLGEYRLEQQGEFYKTTALCVSVYDTKNSKLAASRDVESRVLEG